MLANLTPAHAQIGLKVLSALNIPLPLVSIVLSAINGNTLLNSEGVINEKAVEELLSQVVPLLPWNSTPTIADVQKERLIACKCCTTINKVK